jgi:hypothetical protein
VNTEIAQARLLRLKADTVIKGLGLPREVKTAVLTAIGQVTMPLFRYYKDSDEQIKQSFIKLVIGGMGNKVEDNYKEKILLCLSKKL